MPMTDLADDPDDLRHSPEKPASAAARSTWVSVGVTLMLTITQGAVGILAKSQGLVADGMHPLSDLLADVVVLFAGHHAREGADEGHPCGHQRFETAVSLAVGICMPWSAFRKLKVPDLVQQAHSRPDLVHAGAAVPAG